MISNVFLLFLAGMYLSNLFYHENIALKWRTVSKHS